VIILDASVAIKWYFPETGSDAAIDILNGSSGALIAPDIFAIEVNAALVRSGNMDKSQREGIRLMIADFAEKLTRQQIRLTRLTGVEIAKASNLALDIGHPLKDCIYLSLAMGLDCDLVTCDARFAKKAKDVWDRVLGL
jgi:predicted nucleic acid-binding protein